ncbi:MAG: hypothetical protein K2L01_04105 [Rikenellaceae bacterium]|nr:hypothetical protein [Rikenellaceae bacterium]
MDGIENILRIVSDLVLGSGIVSLLLFYRTRHRRESAEAVTAEAQAASAELDVNKAQIEHLSRQLVDSFSENVKVQELVSRERARIVDLMRQLGEIEIKFLEEERRRKRAERDACTVENCASRAVRYDLSADTGLNA